MGSGYSCDHIAEDNIHADIPTYNIEDPQQKYRFRTVVIGGCGGKGLKHVLLDPNLTLYFYSDSKHLIRMKVPLV